MIRVSLDQIWNPGNFVFSKNICLIMLSIKPINFYLKDIFLYNAADQGSWNPWGLSSNKFSQKVLKFLIKLNNKLNLETALVP